MIERLTFGEARARVLANTTDPECPVEPDLDWSQPGREAVTIAGLLGSTDPKHHAAITAVALALIGYEAHLAYIEGRDGPGRHFMFADGQAFEVHR